MFCNNCGESNPENSKFCSSCGSAIKRAENTTGTPYTGNTYHSPPPNHGNYQQQNTYYNNSNDDFDFNKPNKKKKKGCGCILPIIGFVVLVLIFFIWILLDDDVTDYDEMVNSQPNHNIHTNTDFPHVGDGVYGEDLEIAGLRDFYTTYKNDGSDVHTIMVYLMGSDLESEAGFASDDIYEMLAADFSDNINLVLMTGGSNFWYHESISSYTCQYWQVKDGNLISIADDLGMLNMASEYTLSGFINDMATQFPADRYSLIMWNHGGGTFSGFGYDENFPDDTLTLASLSDAFAMSSVKFDFVGFDACLMATAETALMLEPYADYLIASQELEPGSGWYYTDWLTNLSLQPSLSTVDLGVLIVDDFVEYCEDSQYFPNATLSVVELRQMPYTYDVLTDYFANATIDIQNNQYRELSRARNNAKDFGDGDYEQIDVVDYIMQTDVEGGEEVISAIDSAVKYYHSSSDVYGAYGLAMYFPYDYPDYYTDMQDVLHYVGFSGEYTRFFNVFISAMWGGQMQWSRSSGADLEADYSTESWYDSETSLVYEEEYSSDTFTELLLLEKGEDFVLSLSDEQWEDINTIELQVLLDDGEGYIDLGSDNVYEFDKDGDLIVEFDYTWVALDGNVVPFYAEGETVNDNGTWHSYGYVPAFLNSDEYIEIVLRWDDKNPSGFVQGYRKYTEAGHPAGKGLFDLTPGDMLDWVIDYYTYEGDYDDFYLYGDTYTVPNEPMLVSYEYVGDNDALIYFVLTDYYNNVFETEAVHYTD